MDSSSRQQAVLVSGPRAEQPVADGAGTLFERWLGLSAYAIVMMAGAAAVLL